MDVGGGIRPRKKCGPPTHVRAPMHTCASTSAAWCGGSDAVVPPMLAEVTALGKRESSETTRAESTASPSNAMNSEPLPPATVDSTMSMKSAVEDQRLWESDAGRLMASYERSRRVRTLRRSDMLVVVAVAAMAVARASTVLAAWSTACTAWT